MIPKSRRSFGGVVVTAISLTLCASIATSAYAASKILLNGAPITKETNVTVTSFMLLEDMNAFGTPAILCSHILKWILHPFTEIWLYIGELTLAGDLLKPDGTVGTSTDGEPDRIECESSGTCQGAVIILTLNLPWVATIELDAGGQYLLHTLTKAEAGEEGGEPTYAVLCKTILGEIEDVCGGLTSSRLVNTGEGLLEFYNSLAIGEPWGAESEAVNCTIGGAGQGLIESLNEAGESDTENSGSSVGSPEGTLTVSE